MDRGPDGLRERYRRLKLVCEKRRAGEPIAELLQPARKLLALLRRRAHRLPASASCPAHLVYTWRNPYESVPRIRRAAGRLHHTLAPSETDRQKRQWARETLVEAMERHAADGVFDDPDTESALAYVLDIQDAGRTYAGPPTCPATARNAIFIKRARRAAMDRLESFTEPDFLWARLIHLSNTAGYMEAQSGLASDPEGARIYDPMSFQKMHANACADLLTALGTLVLRPECSRWIAHRNLTYGPTLEWRIGPRYGGVLLGIRPRPDSEIIT